MCVPLGSILCDGGTSRPPSFHSNENIDVMDILLHYLTADCYFSIFLKDYFFKLRSKQKKKFRFNLLF